MKWNPKKIKSNVSSADYHHHGRHLNDGVGATQLKAKDASSAGLLTKCTTRSETNKGSRCQERSSLIVKVEVREHPAGLLSKIS